MHQEPIRKEPVSDTMIFRTDAHGVTRNRYFNRYVNHFKIDILDHGHFIGNITWNQYGVTSPFARIYCMISDSGWLDTEHGRIDLIPGNMYLIPPNTKVDLRTGARIEKYFFHVTWYYAETDMLDRINRSFVLPFSGEDLAHLDSAYRGTGPADFLMVKGLITEYLARFMLECFPAQAQNLETADRYRPIYSYVEKNLSAKLSPSVICRDLGLSYETVRRQFSRDNGITMHKYLINRIISKAGMHLLLTDKNIQEIAAELGFDDEFYFSRLFKQKMNYSPREYRRINALLR